MLSTNETQTGKPRDGRHCDLCGSSSPVVKCEKCNNQLFCLSCDDMYHRHPRRQSHNRKAVQTLGTLIRKPPPARVPLENVSEDGQPIAAKPVAPPRKKKFHSFLNKTPGLPKKELSWSERLNSLKRFMGARPLPPTPPGINNNLPPLPPRNSVSPAPELHHFRSEIDSQFIPVPVMEMNKPNQTGTLNRSYSLRRTPGEIGGRHAQLISESAHSMKDWEESQPRPEGTMKGEFFHPQGYFGNPMVGLMNQSTSVSDLQSLMQQQAEAGFHHHPGMHAVPPMGLGPAQSMTHLNYPHFMQMHPYWFNPHLMPQCGTCHHHSTATLSDNVPSAHHGSNPNVESEGRTMRATTPRSMKRPPSVARSISSNVSRRSHRRTSSIDETRMRRDERSSLNEWPTLRKEPSPSESSYEESNDDVEEEEEESSDESDGSEEMFDGDKETYENTEVCASEPEKSMKLEAFDEEWECEHCTFINSPGTRICTVCCKTSEKPEFSKINTQKVNKNQPKSSHKKLHSKSKLPKTEEAKNSGKKGVVNKEDEMKKEIGVAEQQKVRSSMFSSAASTAESEEAAKVFDKPKLKKPVEVAANKEFQYHSLKFRRKNSKIKANKMAESSDPITSESSVHSEPMYMNKQEVDEHSLSERVSNLYINSDVITSHTSQSEYQAETDASESVKNTKKRLARKKKKEEKKKGKANKQNEPKESVPPRPTEAKPKIKEIAPISTFLNKHLPPPPTFDDGKKQKVSKVPSPLVIRKDKPRLRTPPEDTYENMQPMDNYEKICSNNIAKPTIPTPTSLTEPDVAVSDEIIKAQEKAEMAIKEQLYQKEELRKFQQMREHELKHETNNPMKMTAGQPQSIITSNTVNQNQNLAPNNRATTVISKTDYIVPNVGVNLEINQSLPKTMDSAGDSFSSAMSNLSRQDGGSQMQPLNVNLNFNGNDQNIAPKVASPMSDTTEDFQSTCASPSELRSRLERISTGIGANLPANGIQNRPNNQGLLAIAMPRPQTEEAKLVEQQPTIINAGLDNQQMPAESLPMDYKFVSQDQVHSNLWMQNPPNQQARMQTAGNIPPIKPPTSSQWFTQQAPWNGSSNNFNFEQPKSFNQQNVWMPQQSSYMSNVGQYPENQRAQQQNAYFNRGWSGNNGDNGDQDWTNRRQSQPQVPHFNGGYTSWGNDLQPGNNLRRAYSQTSLNKLWANQNQASPFHQPSMQRSSSRISLGGDGNQFGMAQSMMDINGFRSSPGSSHSYGQNFMSEDEGRVPDRIQSKGYCTLPRSLAMDDRRYFEQERSRKKKSKDYYLSMEELVQKRKHDSLRKQGFELVGLLREAEKLNFTAEDVQVAMNHCGSKENPIKWLKENWKNMVETVVTLATNYGHDKRENDVGILSSEEARDALRQHLGNVWAAVTECVESRQRKVMELMARRDFAKQEVVVALSSNQGDIEAAFEELTKADAKPFQMNIWAPKYNNNLDAANNDDKNSDDDDYKPASDTFSMFSTPVDLKKLGFIGKIDQHDEEQQKINTFKNEREETSSEEDDTKDQTITQWLIRDSYRPRVKVEVNEEKKMKSVEMIRAALNKGKEKKSKEEKKSKKQKEKSATSKETTESDKPQEKKKENISKENNKQDVAVAGSSNEKQDKEVEVTERKRFPLPKSKANKEEQERKIRMLLAEGKCESYNQAETATKLLDMMFNEEQALTASKECGDVYQALNYLHQDCELCIEQYPAAQMVSMIHCTHRACQNCAKTYFTLQIRDRNIMEAKCPFCDEPDLTDEDIAQDYFNHLDRLLKTLIDDNTYELFQRKLRDRVLMDDPNFKWCSQCSSGFIANPNLKKLVCPDCRNVMCGKCLMKWEDQHEGISCEKFKLWKDSNDPDHQAAGVDKHLEQNGIQCPKCKFKFSLARGGCMHYKCTQCQYEFCSGCKKPFKMGAKCGKATICAKLGLHAHHPRNCLFYLRDKEPEDLQKLLREHKTEYKTDVDADDGNEDSVQKKCMIMEQKETEEGLKDEPCNKDVEESSAGFCRGHYIEYLGGLITKNKIDPLILMNEDELELILKRAEIRLPFKPWREKPDEYRRKLINRIQDVLPLENEIVT